jgi:hypothetical protein
LLSIPTRWHCLCATHCVVASLSVLLFALFLLYHSKKYVRNSKSKKKKIENELMASESKENNRTSDSRKYPAAPLSRSSRARLLRWNVGWKALGGLICAAWVFSQTQQRGHGASCCCARKVLTPDTSMQLAQFDEKLQPS